MCGLEITFIILMVIVLGGAFVIIFSAMYSDLKYDKEKLKSLDPTQNLETGCTKCKECSKKGIKSLDPTENIKNK